MSLRKIGFWVFFIIIGFVSCNNDDDIGIPSVELLNREDQQKVDDSLIVDYLNTHYYNSNAFEVSNENARIADLVITELEDGENVPDGHALLMGAVEDFNFEFEDTEYIFYILKLRQGSGGNSPTFADDIRAQYEGLTLDGSTFEDNLNSPISFNLLATITGWQRVFPNFNVAESFNIQNDGIVNFNKPGIGVMFIPSGLAYFNQGSSSTLLRDPLIFKFELLQVFETDLDEDGIPSYLEDVNNDELFTLTEFADDTDEDFLLNLEDPDDDNDGVLTEDEIAIRYVEASTREEVLATNIESNEVLVNFIEPLKNEAGEIMSYKGKIITFTDTDGDGTPDYLDAE